MNTPSTKSPEKKRNIILTSIWFIILALIFFFTILYYYYSGIKEVLTIAITCFALFIGTLALLPVNIQSFFTSDVYRSSRDDRLLRLEKKIQSIENKSTTLLTQKEHQELVKRLASGLHSEAVDSLINTRVDEISRKYEQLWSNKQFQDATEDIKERLLQQVAAFGSRANINLTLGLLFSIFGTLVLVYFSLSIKDTEDFTTFLIHFLPRISLVLLIELFAYFFLQLYKQGINDTRFFQNEITNIESKFLAIILSQKAAPDKMEAIIQALSTSERNFIIQKDQRLVSEAIDSKVETAMERYLSILKDLTPKSDRK